MSSVELPVPTSNPDSARYWDAASEDKLVVQRCAACDLRRFPPRHLCPRCWSDQTEWMETAGQGTVHAVTIVRRAPSPAFQAQVPFVLAVIDLQEGPRLLTNIVGERAEQAEIGAAVHVTFETRGDRKIPQFRLGDTRR